MTKFHIVFLIALVGQAQTGNPVPELTAFDSAFPALLRKYGIPGGSVAIAKDSRLVFARGFGAADVVTNEPVQPDSLFRIASVSKPITAIGVLKLVEEGKITLDTKVLAYVGRKSGTDPRFNDITVRHLLQHSSGMDIEFWGFDPSFPDRKTVLALGGNFPPSRADVLDYAIANLPLAFAPGARYAYSNIGFMLLTEVIEKATGLPYETYMRTRILAPLGIVRMRIAGSLLTERQPGEVRYFDKDNVDEPIFPGLPATVPLPYGTFNLRIFESGGGWLATTVDLVRLLSAFDAASGYSILRPDTIRQMTERPSYAAAAEWYGLGWTVTRAAGTERWSHDGALPGTAALAVRNLNGVSFAAAINHLPEDAVLLEFFKDLEGLLNPSVFALTKWPANNIFDTYFPNQAPRISHAGVVNAASQRPGPVAAGSIVTVFGVNLDGGSVRVNGSVVPTLWSSPNQLQVRVPASSNGPTNFEVFRYGQYSNTQTLSVQNDAPALFTVSRNGYGPAAAIVQNGAVVLYATGALDPELTIGGKLARVFYTGPVPGLPVGVLQINALLPAGLPSGDAEVQLKGANQSGVSISIP